MSTACEAHSVAPQTKLEGSRITRKGDTSSQVTPHPSKMVAGGKQFAQRSTITPIDTCSAIVYRHIKRRLGCSLKRSHCKENLVPSRKQATHKLPGTKGGVSGPKRVPRPLPEQHSSDSDRQHHSGCLHKQKGGGGGRIMSGPLCALLWRILTWCTSKQVILKT